MLRVGHGFDAHKLTVGRKLILCGVEIPFAKGLDGHSDADVAVHALMDALLGAAGLFDIGRHFSDKDEAYRDISSITLLEKVMEFLEEKEATVNNVDITILAQEPKLFSYIDKMRDVVANAIGISTNRVNVKATTTEKMGFVGKEEGIAAHSVCIIEMK